MVMAAVQASTSSSTNELENASRNAPSPEKATPARNLTQAFEAMCVEDEHKEEERGSGKGGDGSVALTDGSERSGGRRDATSSSSTSSSVLTPASLSLRTPSAAADAAAKAAAKLAFISPTGVADFQQPQGQHQQPTPKVAFITGSSKNTQSTAGSTAGTSTNKSGGSSTAPAAVVAAVSDEKRPPSVIAVSTSSSSNSGGVKLNRKRHPYLGLHPDLRRDLSQALVDRVSFYAIIHDINKEASAMACNDPALNGSSSSSEPFTFGGSSAANEERSALVVAALCGDPSLVLQEAAAAALIDEEEWLLSTIASRNSPGGGKDSFNENDSISSTGSAAAAGGKRGGAARACPDTFLQAMGEKEYENPVASLAGNTRTQLWKPSRSWWEAKSGKNPWIEPSSHNKRWRYLWPLIHYHKFLAKCIKKLKRNGVDVKQSVSPVAVFLREEVCAVSDHLASLSLFDSDEWMACLAHFHGWTDPNAEDAYRDAVASLKLRPLAEPGDVDSPLLRSQIDEHFLRTMATARAQLREAAPTERKKRSDGPPPVYPRGSPTVPKHIHQFSGSMSNGTNYLQRQQPQRWSYPGPHGQQLLHPQQQQVHPNGWWNPQMDASQEAGQQPQAQAAASTKGQAYGDSSAVHSGLSPESGSAYPTTQPPAYPHSHHRQPYPPFYPPYPQGSDATNASGPPGYYYNHDGTPMYDPLMAAMQHANGWGVDPAMMYAMQFQQQTGYYPAHPHHLHHVMHQPPPSAPRLTTGSGPSGNGAAATSIPSTGPEDDAAANTTSVDLQPYAVMSETPQKRTSDYTQSPFWSHLDQATLAMGLATPAKSSPLRPRRSDTDLQAHDTTSDGTPSYAADDCGSTSAGDSTGQDDSIGFAVNAQPLLLQHGQYYGYSSGMQYGAGEGGYGPPSPATQFMMSPQASFAYTYGYAYSPGRQHGRNTTTPRANRSKSMTTGSNTFEKSPTQSDRTLHADAQSSTAATRASDITPPPAVRKVAPSGPVGSDRGSPATVETTAESESLHESAA